MQFSNDAMSANGMSRMNDCCPCVTFTSRWSRAIFTVCTCTSASISSLHVKNEVVVGTCVRMNCMTFPACPITHRHVVNRRAFSASFSSREEKFSSWASPRCVNIPISGRIICWSRCISPFWDIPASIMAMSAFVSIPSKESGTPTCEL